MLTLDIRLHTVRLLAALVVAAWVPARIALIDARFLPTDYVLDAVLLVIGLMTLRQRWTAARDALGATGGGKLLDSAIKGSHFVGDLLVAFPALTVVSMVAPDLPFAPSLFLLAKLFALESLPRVRDWIDRLDSLHPIVERLLPLAVFVPIAIHIVACGWIELGSGNTPDVPTDHDHLTAYVKAVYWAVTTLTTVGYGDISAKTIPQMLYATVTMLFGVGFFGYIISNIAGMLARMDAAKLHRTEVEDKVEAFMSCHDIAPDVKRRVREYFRYLWENHRGYEDEAVLAMLPQNLRAEISLHLSAGLIEKAPLLHGAEPEVLRDVVLELRAVVAIPGERIFNVGDLGEEMYLIQKGTVEVRTGTGEPIALLRDGSVFGEIALIDELPRTATAVALTYCDLYVLPKEGFDRVLVRHPAFAERLDLVKSQRQRTNETRKAS